MRNKYIDGTLADARARGFDTVQLKFDGHWCKCVSLDGRQQYFSDTDRMFHQSAYPISDCTLVGEFMRGTQWAQRADRKGLFYVFDIWDFKSTHITWAYRQRLKFARVVVEPALTFQIVQSFHISDRDAVWANHVDNNEFEGVIYRLSTDENPFCDIIREKRVVTLEGRVTGFQPGTGKHEGRLGALEIDIISTGAKTTLGNGFSDEERDYIWTHQAGFIGRVCEFEASAVFASGSVRHARFIRWREDR